MHATLGPTRFCVEKVPRSIPLYQGPLSAFREGTKDERIGIRKLRVVPRGNFEI